MFGFSVYLPLPGRLPGQPLEDTHKGHLPATARQRFTDGPLILCSVRMGHVGYTDTLRKYNQYFRAVAQLG